MSHGTALLILIINITINIVLGCHSKLRNGDVQSRQPLAVPAVQPVEDGIVCWVLKSWPIFEQKTPREVPVVAGLSTNGHIS